MPVLFLLFVASGAAALIYEIVWFQLLELYIGSSSISMAHWWIQAWISPMQ